MPYDPDDPFGTRRWVQQAFRTSTLYGVNLARSRAFDAMFKPSLDALKNIWVPQVDPFAPLRRQLSGILGDFEKIFRDRLPPNWRDLDGEDVEKLPGLASRHALGVAHVPSHEILVELLEASDETQEAAVLLARAEDICSDAEKVLQRCASESPHLEDLLSLAKQAAHAFGEGHYAAAQALAANVVDTAGMQLLNGGATRVSERFREWSQVTPADDFWKWLFGVVVTGLRPAYERYEYQSGDPLYNRHATAHCADLTTYSKLNAVRALTLMTSLLAWMDNEPFFRYGDGQSDIK